MFSKSGTGTLDRSGPEPKLRSSIGTTLICPAGLDKVPRAVLGGGTGRTFCELTGAKESADR